MFRLSLALACVFILLSAAGASARDVATSAKSQSAAAPARVKRRGTIQRRAGFRAQTAPAQRTCGAFMYFKSGKCNDARDKN
jgi:hypothetical protein